MHVRGGQTEVVTVAVKELVDVTVTVTAGGQVPGELVVEVVVVGGFVIKQLQALLILDGESKHFVAKPGKPVFATFICVV